MVFIRVLGIPYTGSPIHSTAANAFFHVFFPSCLLINNSNNNKEKNKQTMLSITGIKGQTITFY